MTEFCRKKESFLMIWFLHFGIHIRGEKSNKVFFSGSVKCETLEITLQRIMIVLRLSLVVGN
jgi:hypothetical protein